MTPDRLRLRAVLYVDRRVHERSGVEVSKT